MEVVGGALIALNSLYRSLLLNDGTICYMYVCVCMYVCLMDKNTRRAQPQQKCCGGCFVVPFSSETS